MLPRLVGCTLSTAQASRREIRTEDSTRKAQCPQLAKADISPKRVASGFDPTRTSATQFCCPAQRAWLCARLTPSPPGGLRETARHSRPETCEEAAATQADGTEAQQCGKGRASSQFNP